MSIVSSMLMAGSLFIATASVAVAAAGTEADADTERKRPAVETMSGADIRKFNTGLDPKDRFYIVCRSYIATGSWAKRTRICRTNQDWDRIGRDGQNFTNEITERSRSMPNPQECSPNC